MKKLITEEGRECSTCDDFKTWDNYNKTKATKTGYQSRCKECSAKVAKKYIKKKPLDGVFMPERGFNYMAQCFYLSKRC